MRSFSGQLGTALSAPGNLVPGLVPTAAIRAKQCFVPRSSWVHAFILTCDDKLAVWFKRRPRGARRAARVPGVCCLYPQSTRRLYDLAVTWPSAGRFVHRFLYRLLAYVPVAPPKAPCGGDCSAAGVVVGCCANALPATLHVTLTGGISGTYALTYSGSLSVWESGNVLLCGTSTSVIQLGCQGGVWELAISGDSGGCQTGQTPADSASCSPFDLIFNALQTLPAGCCHGLAIRAEVTT